MGVQTQAPSPSPSVAFGIHAPAGQTTEGTVVGTIYLGFEACVGLTPGPQSPFLPPLGPERDFVLFFPSGWKVVPAHPRHPRYGDDFQVLDRSGKVVAEAGDVLVATGEIAAISATFCGFGWPVRVSEARRAP